MNMAVLHCPVPEPALPDPPSDTLLEDPFLGVYCHPILPAGLNTTDVNGDELNGPGVDWEVWPELLYSFVTLRPLTIDENDLAMFDTVCFDLCVKGCRRRRRDEE